MSNVAPFAKKKILVCVNIPGNKRIRILILIIRIWYFRILANALMGLSSLRSIHHTHMFGQTVGTRVSYLVLGGIKGEISNIQSVALLQQLLLIIAVTLTTQTKGVISISTTSELLHLQVKLHLSSRVI